MMHQRSYQATWQYIPFAAPPKSRWQRFSDAVKDIFTPLDVARFGRRRIDPDAPYGCWANGWSKATMPAPALGKHLAQAEMEGNA